MSNKSKEENSAIGLTDVVRSLISNELKQRDDTVLACIVTNHNDTTYDLYVEPDTETIIHNVPCISGMPSLKEGDYVYVYKIDNQFAKAFIIKSLSQVENTKDTSSTSIIYSGDGEGSGKIDSISVESVQKEIVNKNVNLNLSDFGIALTDKKVNNSDIKYIQTSDGKAVAVEYATKATQDANGKDFTTYYMPTFGVAPITSWSWGTLLPSNGYTQLYSIESLDYAALAFASKAGGSNAQLSMQIDGRFYDQEGQYRLVDTNDLTSELSNYLKTTDSLDIAKLTQGTYYTAEVLNKYDVLLQNETSADRLAFLDPQYVTIEYSTDGGTTWVDSGYSDYMKRFLFSHPFSTNISIGKSASGSISLTNSNYTNYLTRLIITYPANRYCMIDKCFMYFLSQGHTVQVQTKYTTYGAQTSEQLWRDWTPLSGWPDNNAFSLTAHTCFYSNYTHHIYKIIFTFKYTAINSAYANNASQFGDIRMYGDRSWGTYCKRDTPYQFSEIASILPRPGFAGVSNLGDSSGKWNNVYANTFYGTLSGNATSATKLTTSAGSSTQPVYFSDGKPVACDATLGVNISGTAASSTSATTSTNLTSAGYFAIGSQSSSAITFTVGGKTSNEFTIPYATKAGSATSATSATTATSATKATQDGDGNVISSTYAKNSSIGNGTLTILVNGNTVGTFTANQNSNATIPINFTDGTLPECPVTDVGDTYALKATVQQLSYSGSIDIGTVKSGPNTSTDASGKIKGNLIPGTIKLGGSYDTNKGDGTGTWVFNETLTGTGYSATVNYTTGAIYVAGKINTTGTTTRSFAIRISEYSYKTVVPTWVKE